jgi:hypothetical protein
MNKKIIDIQIPLTDRQKEIFELYTKGGLNQKEISIKVYGTIHKQNKVSGVLQAVSKKLGFPITSAFHKRYPQSLYQVTIKQIRGY